MKTDKQVYKDIDDPKLYPSSCNTAQLKYDGWWTRVHYVDGTLTIYSASNRALNVVHQNFDLPEFVLVGEYMYGTQWAQHPDRLGRFYCFDCWYCGEDITETAYSARYTIAKQIVHCLPDELKFCMVANYPIVQTPSLWDRHVVNGDFEGLVFRHSLGRVNDLLYRVKKIVTLEGTILRINPGTEDGKYAHTMGSVTVLLPSGITCDVGGGWEDKDRDQIWLNQSAFIGRGLEIEARHIFESGAPRHPNFLRWRDDKSIDSTKSST